MIDIVVKKYSEFLSDNWAQINQMINRSGLLNQLAKQDLLEDWLQINWELLVCVVLGGEEVFVTEYGATNYRFFNPREISESTQLQEPYCKGLSIEGVQDELTSKFIKTDEMSFVQFVNYRDGQYFEEAPFDFVLLNDLKSNKFVVNKAKIVFDLRDTDG